MRKQFVDYLKQMMSKDDRIFLLTGDLGYGLFDSLRDTFPDRYYNVGAAETALIDIGIGLALEGKIPFCYSITPFLLYRPFESLRTYLNHEKINVKLIGSGRDKDYLHDGISHWAQDASNILDQLPNIEQFYPHIPTQIPEIVDKMIETEGTQFLSLCR